MYRLFDKHGTKFLAVIGSLLMLAFILPSNWTQRGNGAYRYGKLDGQEIDGDAVRNSAEAFRSLGNVILATPDREGQTTPTPLPQLLFREAPQILQQFRDDPVQWYLLVREAERAGVVPDETSIESVLTGPTTMLRTEDGQMLPMKQINPNVRDSYGAALAQALAVREYFGRSLRAVKISAPAVDDALARKFEQLRIRAVSFDASTYAGKITPPTQDDLMNQFKAYADTAPGITADNPFGFGYRVPDRVKIQWINVPDSEVARSVEASKSPELWEEDAIIYYQKNLSSFQTATTQPTTRPYADAKVDALKQLRQPLIDQKRRTIANRITQQMQADARAAGQGGKATTQQSLEAATSYGVPYGSFDYLRKLSDDIQSQFGVKVTIVNEAAPASRDHLQAPDALGLAYTDDGTPAAMYVFSSLTAFNPAGTLTIGEPSKVMSSDMGLYIARVMAAEPAHPPANLSDVKAQVVKDLQRQREFAAASDAAKQAVADAKKSGDLSKVAGIKPMTSEWFGSTTEKIPGLTADDAYAPTLISSAFDALRGTSSVTQLPKYTLAKVEQSGVVIAMELFDVKTTLSTTDEPRERILAANELEQQVFQPAMVQQWFSLPSISQRMNYAPDEQTKRPALPSGAPPQAPASPFIPG